MKNLAFNFILRERTPPSTFEDASECRRSTRGVDVDDPRVLNADADVVDVDVVDLDV